MDFWKAFKIRPIVCNTIDIEPFHSEKISPVDKPHTLETSQAAVLSSVIREFVFSKEGVLAYTKVLSHSIDTQGAKPIKQCQYVVSPYLQKEIHAEIDRMIALDVIEPASSPWRNPMVVVRKASGKIRLCIDARKLNAVTVKEAFPIPQINRTLGLLEGTKFLTAIDLNDAFFQVMLDSESRPKTAFAISGRGFFSI